MHPEDKYLKDLVKPIKLNWSTRVELSTALAIIVIFVPEINRLTSFLDIETKVSTRHLSDSHFREFGV